MGRNDWKQKIREFTHHAYCVVGDPLVMRGELFDLLKNELKIQSKGNPDFSHYVSDTFTIDEARALKERVSGKGFAGARKIFVIECRSITLEAQNSLLKIFEEPTQGTLFFLIVESDEFLLATVRSRLMIFKQDRTSDESDSRQVIEAESFLKAKLPERMQIVKKLADDISDENKTKNDAIHFIKNLETAFAGNLGNLKKYPEVFGAILRSERDIALSGASVKMLLESIAIILPTE